MRRPEFPTRRNLALLVVGYLLIFTVQIGLQVANHGYTSEFARTYDEAGHYVTGLMVHDFIAGLDWRTPMAFAENYYLHYPKVALGHWPPFYYLIQATWTLLFSPSRTSIMILMALLTSLLALIIGSSLRREFGWWAGMGGGLLFLALPLVQANTSVLMLEVCLALFAFLAAISFGKYLDTESSRWAAGFTIFAILAIMTKANGLALGLLPPLALLTIRRTHLLFRASFWIPAVVVAVVCGPWYWLTLDMLKNGVLAQSPQWSYTLTAIPTFSGQLVDSLGFGLLGLFGVGFFSKIVRATTAGTLEGRWVALLSLLFATLIFHWIVPADFEPRHLIMAMPPAICFIVAGIAYLSKRIRLPGLTQTRTAVLLMILAIGLFLFETFAILGKPWRGFGSVADHILSRPDLESSVLLISSDPAGEGAFVSEVARREQRPGHFVLRGSKVLSNSRWDGSNYQLFFDTTGKMWDFLRETPVGVVVVDRSVSPRLVTPDQQVLWETLEATAEHWTPLGTFTLVRNATEHPKAVQLYAQQGHQERQRRSISVNLTEMLGRQVVSGAGEIPDPD